MGEMGRGENGIPIWLKRLPLAPIYYPTEAEFADPIAYISKIENEASEYGICKIVPPVPRPSRKQVIENLNKTLQDTQEIPPPSAVHGSAPPSSLSRSMTSCGEKLSRSMTDCGVSCLADIACGRPDVEEGKRVAHFSTRLQQVGWNHKKIKSPEQLFEEKPVWQTGEVYTIEEFEAKARTFYRSQLGTSREVPPLIVEKMFWKTVSGKPLFVEYANDIPGSAFAEPNSSGSEVDCTMQFHEGYRGMRFTPHGKSISDTAWNMRKIARSPGSLIRYMPDEVPGVTSPMVYIGMLFSWFAWHVEDHELHSLNYLHMGFPKTWYAVPGHAATALEDLIRVEGYGDYLSPLAAFGILGEKTTVLSPEVLVEEGIPCFRLVQNPGEFVVTFPRAYHLGFSHGFNCGEAANFATSSWLRFAKEAAIRRAAMNHLPMLSHQQLLYMFTLASPRLPLGISVEPEHWKLKYKKYDKWEMLIKKNFVDDVSSNNYLLSALLERRSTCYAVLWDSSQISCGSSSPCLPAFDNQGWSSKSMRAGSKAFTPGAPIKKESIRCKLERLCGALSLEKPMEKTFDSNGIYSTKSNFGPERKTHSQFHHRLMDVSVDEIPISGKAFIAASKAIPASPSGKLTVGCKQQMLCSSATFDKPVERDSASESGYESETDFSEQSSSDTLHNDELVDVSVNEISLRDDKFLAASPPDQEVHIVCKRQKLGDSHFLDRSTEMVFGSERDNVSKSDVSEKIRPHNLQTHGSEVVSFDEACLKNNIIDTQIFSNDLAKLNSGSLACIACGALGFPCMAVIQISVEAAKCLLFAVDQNDYLKEAVPHSEYPEVFPEEGTELVQNNCDLVKTHQRNMGRANSLTSQLPAFSIENQCEALDQPGKELTFDEHRNAEIKNSVVDTKSQQTSDNMTEISKSEDNFSVSSVKMMTSKKLGSSDSVCEPSALDLLAATYNNESDSDEPDNVNELVQYPLGHNSFTNADSGDFNSVPVIPAPVKLGNGCSEDIYFSEGQEIVNRYFQFSGPSCERETCLHTNVCEKDAAINSKLSLHGERSFLEDKFLRTPRYNHYHITSNEEEPSLVSRYKGKTNNGIERSVNEAVCFSTDSCSLRKEPNIVVEDDNIEENNFQDCIQGNFQKIGGPIPWKPSNGFMRPHVFCLEHALEIEEELSKLGGSKILLICHAEYPKIEEKAKSLATELGIDYFWKNNNIRSAVDDDLHLIQAAIEEQSDEYLGSDWTAKLGVSLRHSVKLSRSIFTKEMPSNKVLYALFQKSLENIHSSRNSRGAYLADLNWQSKGPRSCRVSKDNCSYKHTGTDQVNVNSVERQSFMMDGVNQENDIAFEKPVLHEPRQDCSYDCNYNIVMCIKKPRGRPKKVRQDGTDNNIAPENNVHCINKEKESNIAMTIQRPEITKTFYRKRRKPMETELSNNDAVTATLGVEVDGAISEAPVYVNGCLPTESEALSLERSTCDTICDNEQELDKNTTEVHIDSSCAKDFYPYKLENCLTSNTKGFFQYMTSAADAEKTQTGKENDCIGMENRAGYSSCGRSSNGTICDDEQVLETKATEEQMDVNGAEDFNQDTLENCATSNFEDSPQGIVLGLMAKKTKKTETSRESDCTCSGNKIKLGCERSTSGNEHRSDKNATKEQMDETYVKKINKKEIDSTCSETLGENLSGVDCDCQNFGQSPQMEFADKTTSKNTSTGKAVYKRRKNCLDKHVVGSEACIKDSINSTLSGSTTCLKSQSVKNAATAVARVMKKLSTEQKFLSSRKGKKHRRANRVKSYKEPDDTEFLEPTEFFEQSSLSSGRGRKRRRANCVKSYKEPDDNEFLEQSSVLLRKDNKHRRANSVKSYKEPDDNDFFDCDIEGCTMTFETEQELRIHKRNICTFDECGKKFFSHKYLMQHRRVHLDDRPFSCSWTGCKMTFKWAWAKTEHMRVHTGERPYVCPVAKCEKTFRFVSDFSRHRRKTGHK